MMFLKPDGMIDLEHRADLLQGTPFRSVVVAAARDGQLSILSPDLIECPGAPPAVEGSSRITTPIGSTPGMGR
jgi:hypothetical protein